MLMMQQISSLIKLAKYLLIITIVVLQELHLVFQQGQLFLGKEECLELHISTPQQTTWG